MSTVRTWRSLVLLISLVFTGLLFFKQYLPSSGGLITQDVFDLRGSAVPVSSLITLAEQGLRNRAQAYDRKQGKDELGIDIGDIQDLSSYRASISSTWSRYFHPTHPSLPPSITRRLTSRLDAILSSLDLSYRPSPGADEEMAKSIYMTSPAKNPEFMDQAHSWATENKDWVVKYYSNEGIRSWMKGVFVGREKEGEEMGVRLMKEFEALPKGVLKADVFRYLILLIQGGVYTDMDTASVRPISDWPGIFSSYSSIPTRGDPFLAVLPNLLSLATPDGQPVKMKEQGLESTPPRLIVALEMDAPESGADWREESFTRGMQFVQWTMVARPFHPVFLDVVGTALRIGEKVRGGSMDVPSTLDWTGPGAFSDAVFRYLLVRWGIHPKDLSGSSQPIRAGDVLIYPIHSFRAEASEGWQGEYKLAWHGFSGSWKDDPSDDNEEDRSP